MSPSDFAQAYPGFGEWLTLIVHRIEAVASIYRLSALMSPGIDRLHSHIEFHLRGCLNATITVHDGRSFGMVRQGLVPGPVATSPPPYRGLRLSPPLTCLDPSPPTPV